MPGLFNVAVEAIIQKGDLVLIGQRSWNSDHAPGKWETITGRVEQGENLEAAVKREVKEETGLEVEIVAPYDTFHFFRGESKVEHLGISFWCKYKSGEVILDSAEQIDFKWLNLEQAIELVENPNIKESLRKFARISKIN